MASSRRHVAAHLLVFGILMVTYIVARWRLQLLQHPEEVANAFDVALFDVIVSLGIVPLSLLVVDVWRRRRHRQSRAGLRRLGWISPFLQTVLFVLGSAAVILNAYFATVLGSVPNGLQVFSACAAMVGVLLLVALAIKIRGELILDAQQLSLLSVVHARSIADFDIERAPRWSSIPPPPERNAKNEATNGGLVDSDRRVFVSLLENALNAARAAACETGMSFWRPRYCVTALYLADTDGGALQPIAIAGAEPAYKTHLEQTRTPLFNVVEFKREYDSFHDLRRQAKRTHQPPPCLEDFRRSTRAYASTAGVAFELGRNLYHGGVHRRCLTTSFDFTRKLPHHDRRKHEFEECLAMPIVIFGRKVGVLMFWAHLKYTLRPTDHVYRLISDMIASILELGIATKLVAQWHIDKPLSSFPKNERAADELIGFVNSLRPDFSERSAELA